MQCRNCGGAIMPIGRVEAGYDYCKKPDCVAECHRKPSNLAVVMLHKQGPQVIGLEFAMGHNYMDSHGRLD